MYVFMNVFMYVSINVCMYLSIYECMYVFIYVFMYLCICLCFFVNFKRIKRILLSFEDFAGRPARRDWGLPPLRPQSPRPPPGGLRKSKILAPGDPVPDFLQLVPLASSSGPCADMNAIISCSMYCTFTKAMLKKLLN